MQKTAQITSYKDLIVYQKAKDLTIDILKYFSNKKVGKTKDFLLNQLFRAVSSIGANLAEGFGRNYSKNFRQFVGISRGSAFEVEYWLEVILDLNEFDKTNIQNFIDRNVEICKMLSGLMNKMKGGATKY